QPEQHPCHSCTEQTDQDGEKRDREHTDSGGEIPKLFGVIPMFAVMAHCAATFLLWRSTLLSDRASSGPEPSSSVRCASTSCRRIERPTAVRRSRTSRLSSTPGDRAIAPVISRRFTSSTAL